MTCADMDSVKFMAVQSDASTSELSYKLGSTEYNGLSPTEVREFGLV